MTEKAKQIVIEELQNLKKELIDKYNELKMKASGDWEKSLEVEVTQQKSGIKGVIKGVDYSYYMQHGRPSGRMPPLQVIEQWIISKGLKPLEDKIKISSLAFLIARKIAQQGTKRHQTQGTPPFIDAVITPERIQQIIDKVGYQYSVTIQADIINFLKNQKI